MGEEEERLHLGNITLTVHESSQLPVCFLTHEYCFHKDVLQTNRLYAVMVAIYIKPLVWPNHGATKATER